MKVVIARMCRTRSNSGVRSVGAIFLLLAGCQAEMGGTEVPGGSGTQAGSGNGAANGAGGSGGTASSGGGPAAGAGGTNPSGGSPAGGGAGLPGAGTGSGGTSTDCTEPQAATVPLRLLTKSQYDNTVLDILQVAGSPAEGFAQGLDDIALEQRATVAAAIATEAAANVARWAPCTPTTGNSEACGQQIIDLIGEKAYRRPLAESERAELTALFDAGVAEKDFVTGLEWFLTGLLQSPDFMYEVVRPVAGESPGEVRPLAAHEFASRLSYFIWDGPPDAALSAAAANDALNDPVQRDAEVLRMMSDARSSRGIAQFYTRWLGMKGFDELARDAPGFDQELVGALSTSLLMSATELYKAQNPSITTLFSGDTYYLNDVLRTFYGVAGTGSDFAATPMGGESRRGILTHPAMMALLARPGESFPIGRGLHLLRNILCQVISAPDGIEIPPLPPLVEGTSTRERLEAHTANPQCQGCHGMINPAGFVFESFDEVGRFRMTDHGRPVDSSGTLDLGLPDIDGAFATGDEFLAKLGDSQAVRACFAEKYLDYALARTVTDAADACSIRKLGESFGASGDLKGLVASVAGSDAFRMRRAEGVLQ